MKRLVIAAMLVAFASGAMAQGMSGGKGLRNMKDSSKKPEEAPKVDEKAYQQALERIPASKEKYDPWGGVRDDKKK